MNFDLSEEQGLLRDLIERFAADRYDAVKRLSYLRQPGGYCPQGWAMLAEMGVLAFPFGEALGGLGGGGVELITIMEAIGRAVAVEPLLPVIVMAGGILDKAGTEPQRERWLRPVIAGETIAAFAHSEHGARFDQSHVATRAEPAGGNWIVNGAKQMVPAAGSADIFAVSATKPDGAVGLFLVPADAPGLSVRGYHMVDGSVAGDLVLSGVSAEPMEGGQAAIDAVLDEARLAICGELLGLMTMMFDATLDYLKTRRQFGQPIGSFQAIQHRMADNYGLLELSRSQLYRAAAMTADDPARESAIAGAKAYIGGSAMALGEDAVQLHGGIGTTEELMVGQAFKRVLLLASLLGDSDWEMRRYLAMMG
ncbi:MAG: acyl-CoA dehydrogenase family protein [Sphingobium sp.]